MIRRLCDGDSLTLPEYGVEAQKIRALWLAYSAKYDFCRFYETDGAAFCEQERKIVLCTFGKCDYSEISEFLVFIGAEEIFCSEEDAKELHSYTACTFDIVNVMRFDGEGADFEIERNPPFRVAFSVISSAFNLTESAFEPWYLDMSHRVRHNISMIFRRKSSVLVVQHDLNGEVLLSQIATLPKMQRMGNASELILSVCSEYRGKKIYVICDDCLAGFYRKIGFTFECRKAIINI